MGARDFPPLVDADQLLGAVWREFLAPPPRLTVTEWAERNRVLSGKDSAEPGPYRVGRTPYAREPQDCLSPLSPVVEVVLMWGAQTSKTTVMLNCIGSAMDLNPGPVMVVWPTINVAKRNSRQRIAPMIDESAVLKRKVRENRSRDEANTTLLKEYAGGVLAIAGANSAADLRSMPVRDLYLDEIDNYPLDVDGEGDPCQLAEARQTTFARQKRLKTSTPTTKDWSRIEKAYEASDRCRYHVPCPHCGELQRLEWGADAEHGIKWDRDHDGRPIAGTVRYVCKANGCEIREHHKPAMLAGGVWVPERPGAEGGRVRGFHLSSLYSPLGWLSWGKIVEEWHAAMVAARAGDPSLLRVFVNTRLAETFEEQGDRADEHALRRRAADIPLGVVHWGMFVCTMGVDVQGDRLEAYIWGWGRSGERQMVDRQVFHGDPSRPEAEEGSPWRALTEHRRTPIKHASGRLVELMAVMVDSGGHHTQAVYAYCRAHQHARVHAIKGQSVSGRAIIGKPTEQDVSWRGAKIKRGVKLWPIGTDTAKAEIYGRLRTPQPGAGYVWLSKHLPAEVFEQITAERLVTRYVKGHAKLEWVKPSGKRNEALDCAVYALAGYHWAGMDRWSEARWAVMERRVQALPDLVDAAQAAEAAAEQPPEPQPTAAPEAADVPAAAPEAPAAKPPASYTQQLIAARRKARRAV